MSRQKRVVGRFILNEQPTLISIPENYSERLCVMKNNKGKCIVYQIYERKPMLLKIFIKTNERTHFSILHNDNNYNK